MRALLLVGVIACGPPPTGPVAPVGGGGGGGGPPGADLAGSAVAPVEAPAPPACIPAGNFDLDVARVDDDVVVCAVDRAGGHDTIGCWDVDPASGELTARDAIELPGYGHHHDDAWVAATDGRRAVVKQEQLEVFDGSGASIDRRPLVEKKAPDLGTVANVYFVGDTVYVLASGALYAYPIGKPQGRPIKALSAGGVGASGGQLVVHEQALSRLTVADGRTQRTTHGRGHHDDPCHPDASYAFQHEPADGSACAAFLTEHYHPYIDATIIADGGGFIGADPHARAVFALDDHLGETSRYQLRTCPTR